MVGRQLACLICACANANTRPSVQSMVRRQLACLVACANANTRPSVQSMVHSPGFTLTPPRMWGSQHTKGKPDHGHLRLFSSLFSSVCCFGQDPLSSIPDLPCLRHLLPKCLVILPPGWVLCLFESLEDHEHVTHEALGAVREVLRDCCCIGAENLYSK
jgi:hypothetical protein